MFDFNFFNAYEKIAILCHTRPDGDTIGSALALKEAIILSFGKSVDVLCDSEVPDKFLILKGADKIFGGTSQTYDLVVFADCNHLSRTGDVEIKMGNAKTLCIDHHKTYEKFCDFNVIQSEKSATCQIVFDILKASNVEISTDIAECLYTGLLTDTGGFIHSNTTGETMETAAFLLNKGVKNHYINRKIFKERTLDKLHFIGAVINEIKLSENQKIAYFSIDKALLEQYSMSTWDTEGLIDYAMNIKGVQVAFNLMESKPNSYKVSMRSIKAIDVSEIAGHYGGGGHRQASGCMLNGNKYDIISKLLHRISLYIVEE